MRVMMIGFGNVGRRLAQIWSTETSQFPKLKGWAPKVVGITTLTRGSLASPSGVDLERACREVSETGRFSSDNPDHSTLTSLEAVQDLDYDVLIELSTLSIQDRGEPAAGYIQSALERGLNCVTANKGPLAFSYRKLSTLAAQRNLQFLFESTVMDGAPVFNLARNCLRGARILKIEGIVNSTTNFVLGALERGKTLEDAVREAQARGFAEADPSHDLEGWDAAAKICVLANVLMDADTTPTETKREGIRHVTTGQIEAAKSAGRQLKLIASAERKGAGVRTSVRLEEIASNRPFALVEGSGSILRLETDLMGPLTIYQEAPTLNDTAYGVINDLLEIQNSS